MLSDWFGTAMTVPEASDTLRNIEARGWLIRRPGGWMPSAGAYAPTRRLCAGLIRMLGEPEHAAPDHDQLPLIDLSNERNGDETR